MINFDKYHNKYQQMLTKKEKENRPYMIKSRLIKEFKNDLKEIETKIEINKLKNISDSELIGKYRKMSRYNGAQFIINEEVFIAAEDEIIERMLD